MEGRGGGGGGEIGDDAGPGGGRAIMCEVSFPGVVGRRVRTRDSHSNSGGDHNSQKLVKTSKTRMGRPGFPSPAPTTTPRHHFCTTPGRPDDYMTTFWQPPSKNNDFKTIS